MFFKFWGHSLLLFTFLSPLWLSTELLTVCIVVLGGEEQGELSHLIPNKKLMWIFKEKYYTANTKAILNITEFLIMYLLLRILHDSESSLWKSFNQKNFIKINSYKGKFKAWVVFFFTISVENGKFTKLIFFILR